MHIVSSFCLFELGEIESFLLRNGITYQIDRFKLDELECFNLYVENSFVDFVRSHATAIEQALLTKYQALGVSGLWNIQKLVQQP